MAVSRQVGLSKHAFELLGKVKEDNGLLSISGAVLFLCGYEEPDRYSEMGLHALGVGDEMLICVLDEYGEIDLSKTKSIRREVNRINKIEDGTILVLRSVLDSSGSVSISRVPRP